MTDVHGTGAAAAQWYVDPTNPAQWRWWDGTAWTEHVAELRPADQVQAPAEDAQVDPLGVGRWPLPAADAPLVPRSGYSKLAHPSVQKAFAATQVRHAPRLVCVAIGSLVVMAIGAAFLRISSEIFVYGAQMWRRTNHRIRVESRDEPWAAAFRRRGLLPTVGLPGRCSSMPCLIGSSSVEARWSARGELRGFQAVCGELVAEFASEDGDFERWRWMTFAAFEIPPGAASRHRQVAVRQKSRLGGGAAGMKGRRVHLESIAVDEALTIHVHDRTDDVAVRELFGPQLVAALADRPVAWDQRNQWLLVWSESPKEPIVDFDAFLEAATAVARAYWMDQE
jgi:hypothetical protein